MLRWARVVLPVVALVQGACSPTPEEVMTGGSSSSDSSAGTTFGTATPGTTTATPGTTTATPDTTTAAATDASSSSSDEGVMDTTMGSMASSDSSGPPPGCGGPEDCGSNEDCAGGRCVEACDGAWGVGSYDYCLNEFGGIITDEACGPEHTCIYWEDRTDEIEQAACALQGCVDACDCPPPATTGNATVSCGQLTAPETMNDCFLSCADGEECPETMTCNDEGVCVTEALQLAMYGDCGNLVPECDPGYCIDVPTNESVCTMGCEDAMDCPVAIPPGGSATVACTDVVPSVPGFECYLSCVGDPLSCPDGMVCINGTLCMWPD